ncbi:hypothetical protein [Viscerimonas tarda]
MRFLYDRRADKTQGNATSRMDNGGTMAEGSLRASLGIPKERSGIYRTISSSNNAGDTGSVREAEEREELEARGINPDFDRTVFREELPFGRNDSPVSGLRDEEAAASPPLPHPLSQKGDSHSDQREESPAHISNFTERHKQ